MKVRFLSALCLTPADEPGWWRLTASFACRIEEQPEGTMVIMPLDFVTDLATVPRLPLAWLIAGGVANRAAVLHDWLYFRRYRRQWADAVFYAAMREEGVSLWRRWIMWASVRLFGRLIYERRFGLTPGRMA